MEQSVAYLAFSDGYWQVWRMSPDGSQQTQVTHSTYDKSRLSWYPDGQYLLVNGNQGKLVRVNITTGEEVSINLDLEGMNDAVLSPDGQRIAFSLSTAGSVDDNNIWLANADGSDLRKLTNMKYLQHEPTWSPDGGVIYFLSGRGEQSHDIWRLQLPDQSLEQLTTGQLYHFDIAVSLSGTLAFSSNRSGNYEIWLLPPGGESIQLTDHPALDAHPTWSPDGTTLVFESTRGGVTNIWKISARGGKANQLTHYPDGARLPVWWPGDKQ